MGIVSNLPSVSVTLRLVHGGNRMVKPAVLPFSVGRRRLKVVHHQQQRGLAPLPERAPDLQAVNAELKFPSLWVVAGHDGLLYFTPLEYYQQLIQAA